jgi:hypothetical protein
MNSVKRLLQEALGFKTLNGRTPFPASDFQDSFHLSSWKLLYSLSLIFALVQESCAVRFSVSQSVRSVSSVLRILLSLPVHKYLIFAFQVCFALCNIRTLHHISKTLFRKLEISFAILSRNLISNSRGPGSTDIINCLKGRQYPGSVTSCVRARARETYSPLLWMVVYYYEILCEPYIDKAHPNIAFSIYHGIW